LRAEIQRKLEKMQSNTNEGSKIGDSSRSPLIALTGSVALS
jgi:hypothetical protein